MLPPTRNLKYLSASLYTKATAGSSRIMPPHHYLSLLQALRAWRGGCITYILIYVPTFVICWLYILYNHINLHISVIYKIRKTYRHTSKICLFGVCMFQFCYVKSKVLVHITFVFTSFGAGIPRRHMFSDMAMRLVANVSVEYFWNYL